MSFVRLDLKPMEISFDVGIREKHFPSLNPKSSDHLSYHQVNDLNDEFINYVHSKFEYIPDRILYMDIKTENEPLIPHRDHGYMCSLNYYVSTCGEKTKFWKLKEGKTRQSPENFHDDFVKNLYQYENLIFVDEFVAKNYDYYLLDVSQIHSVEVSSSKNIRKIITFIWNEKTYEEVKKSFENKNL